MQGKGLKGVQVSGCQGLGRGGSYVSHGLGDMLIHELVTLYLDFSQEIYTYKGFNEWEAWNI